MQLLPSLAATAMVKYVCAFWNGDVLLPLNTHLKRVHAAPLTTFHKIKYLPPLHMAKDRVLRGAAEASAEIWDPCVPVAWEGHCNLSPVSASVFEGRDAQVRWWVDRTVCCERLKEQSIGLGATDQGEKMWLRSVRRRKLMCSWWGSCHLLLSRKSTKR